MIVGDKIVTCNYTVNGMLVPVRVKETVRGEIVWYVTGTFSVPETCIHDATVIGSVNGDVEIVGRVQKRDRGVTWAPAWIQSEVDLLQVAVALGAQK